MNLIHKIGYLMNINETPVSIGDLRATFSYLVHIKAVIVVVFWLYWKWFELKSSKIGR